MREHTFAVPQLNTKGKHKSKDDDCKLHIALVYDKYLKKAASVLSNKDISYKKPILSFRCHASKIKKKYF